MVGIFSHNRKFDLSEKNLAQLARALPCYGRGHPPQADSDILHNDPGCMVGIFVSHNRKFLAHSEDK
jgi:hypothetical protein